MEIWKEIKGYEGLYEISTCGRIRSMDRVCVRKLPKGKDRICNQKGRIIKLQLNKGTRHGVLPRYQVRVSKNGVTSSIQIHRAVAETFLNCSKDLEVNHKDGNPLNNNIDNLECVSRLENIRHAFENHLIHTSKTVLILNPITKELIREFYSITKASIFLGISQTGLGKKLEKNKEGLIIKEYFVKLK